MVEPEVVKVDIRDEEHVERLKESPKENVDSDEELSESP